MRNLLGKTIDNLLGEADTLSEQQSEAIGQEFEKNQSLIDQLIWKHIIKYGGDYDMLFSRAIDTLLVAYLKFDPARSTWSKFIYHQIRLGLINLRSETVHRKHMIYTNAEEKFRFVSSKAECNHHEAIEDLCVNLTPDARLFLEHTQHDTESKNRREMFGRFRESMLAKGWSRSRIKAATGEVCDILQWMIEGDSE